MTNVQSISNHLMPNDAGCVVLRIEAWDLIGHCELVIGH